MATGSNFGAIVIWNTGPTACRVAGAVAFRAYLADGRSDLNARPIGRLPPVDAVLPAHMRGYRDGTEMTGYLTAALRGFERDDPTRPDARCRQREELAPTVLVVGIGQLSVPVANADPQSALRTRVYGCRGRTLLEEATPAG